MSMTIAATLLGMDRLPHYLPEQVGIRIREARKEIDLTQTKLAQKCGLGQSAISALENGRVDAPEAHTILCLATALKKSPRWLMYGQQQSSWSESDDAIMAELWHSMTADERNKLMAYAQGLLDSRAPDSKPRPAKLPARPKNGHH